MNKKKHIIPLLAVALLLWAMGAKAGRSGVSAVDNDSTATEVAEPVIPESSIVDEVIWVVGDEPIVKSDVEVARLQAAQEGV